MGGRATTGVVGESRLVAAKTVSLHADAESIAMIRNEEKILRGLGDSHPHILPILGFAELPEELTLLTPYAIGGDLSSYLPEREPVEEAEVRKLTLQLVSALAHLHSYAIMHGDVKPQNIFLTEVDGAMLVQLSDFGLSMNLPPGQQSVRREGVRGSYGYIPAEVIDHGEVSLAVDLFALGVMLFRYLGGHDPFYPASQVKSDLEFDEYTWGSVSPAAREFVTQLLAPTAAARGTAANLLDEHSWLARDCSARAGADTSAAGNVRFLDLATARASWGRSCKLATYMVE